MPLYEYECQSCGRRIERIQKFSDPLLTECPHCGGKLEKLVSAPAFQFKGTGWYVTDYARKSEKPDAAKPAEGAKTDAADSKSTGADSKSGGADSKGGGADSKSGGDVAKPATDGGSSSGKSAGTSGASTTSKKD